MKKVYVVTGPDLGWNCVFGVYDHETVDFEELEVKYPSLDYVISTTLVETSVDID